MSDDKLSQEEIDALLNVGTGAEDEGLEEAELLSAVEKDTLGEIGNISFGSSATTMSTLLNQKVSITTPSVSIITKEAFDSEFESGQVRINVDYAQGFNGRNVLLMQAADAAVIADIMLGGDGTSPEQDLGELHLSAVQEVMNQMMGTAATSMSTVFNKRIDIAPPTIQQEEDGDTQNAASLFDDDYLVKISFHLKVGTLIDSHVMQIIPLLFARRLVNQLMAPAGQETEEAATAHEASDQDEKSSKTNHSEDKTETVSNQMREEAATEEPQYLGDKVDSSSAFVQKAAFSDLEPTDFNQSEKQNLDMLLDISLDVSVQLGRTRRTIQDILQLSTGSIIELNKLAGEPVDILINDKLIARGEVVVIDENFGVRVTDIISQSDRLMSLK